MKIKYLIILVFFLFLTKGVNAICSDCNDNNYETGDLDCQCDEAEECKDPYHKSIAYVADKNQHGTDYCYDSNTVAEYYINCGYLWFMDDSLEIDLIDCKRCEKCNDGRCVYDFSSNNGITSYKVVGLPPPGLICDSGMLKESGSCLPADVYYSSGYEGNSNSYEVKLVDKNQKILDIEISGGCAAEIGSVTYSDQIILEGDCFYPDSGSKIKKICWEAYDLVNVYWGLPSGVATTTTSTSTTTTSTTSTTTATICALSSPSIYKNCTGPDGCCQQGDSISMTGTLNGAAPCANANKYQIDASGGTCTIQFLGGDISGITSSAAINPTRTSVSGTWQILSIPADCQGKTVSATYGALWNGNPGIGMRISQIPSPAASGSFAFCSPITTTTTTSTTTTTISDDILGHDQFNCNNILKSCATGLVCDDDVDLLDLLIAEGGCCYDYENWNAEGNYCNKAITGKIYEMTTNSDGSFSEKIFNNIKVLYQIRDSLIFAGNDVIKNVNNQGEFSLNPENHVSGWNSNILFDWKVKLFALDSRNEIIGEWSNSFNDDDEYKSGSGYVNQIVRIHTDMPYWRKSNYESSNYESQKANNTVPQFQLSSAEGSEKAIAVRWNGTLTVDESGNYTIGVYINGGVRLWLNESLVIDNWEYNKSQSERKVNTSLNQDFYPLVVEYYHYLDGTDPMIFWEFENIQKQAIPKSNLERISLDFKEYKASGTSFEELAFDSKSVLYTDNEPNYQVSFIEDPNVYHSERKPVILIHGLHGESGYWKGDDFYKKLQDKGFDVWQFYYPGDQSNYYNSALLGDATEYILKNYPNKKANLVSHSNGGQVALGYVQNLGATPAGIRVLFNDDVEKLLQIAPPNYGVYNVNRLLKDELKPIYLKCKLFEFFFHLMDRDKNEPAYMDLAVGSDFTWEMNSKNLNPTVSYIVITGTQDWNCGSICPEAFEADDSDTFVSVVSASLLNKNIPLITVNKDHGQEIGKSTIPLSQEYQIDDMINIITAFIENQGTTKIKSFLDQGEKYIDGNDVLADSNPFTEGAVLIKFEELNPKRVELSNSQRGYKFSLNVNSYTGVWYHFTDNKTAFFGCVMNTFPIPDLNIIDLGVCGVGIYFEEPTLLKICVNKVLSKFKAELSDYDFYTCLNYKPIDWGLTVPSGIYDLIVDGEDSGYDIEIKAGQTVMYEIRFQETTTTTTTTPITTSTTTVFTTSTTFLPTTTTLVIICDQFTTSCQVSCKDTKCDLAKYEYCVYEWNPPSPCKSITMTIYPGDKAPWMVCTSRGSCILKGKSLIPGTTTTTIPPTGEVILCNNQTTSCYHTCKKCPSDYSYCEYEWTSNCANRTGTLQSGESLPWLVCTTRGTCFMKGYR